MMMIVYNVEKLLSIITHRSLLDDVTVGRLGYPHFGAIFTLAILLTISLLATMNFAYVYKC